MVTYNSSFIDKTIFPENELLNIYLKGKYDDTNFSYKLFYLLNNTYQYALSNRHVNDTNNLLDSMEISEYISYIDSNELLYNHDYVSLLPKKVSEIFHTRTEYSKNILFEETLIARNKENTSAVEKSKHRSKNIEKDREMLLEKYKINYSKFDTLNLLQMFPGRFK